MLLAQIPEELVPFCSLAHRIIEQFRPEGPLEVSGPTCCSKRGQLSDQTRLLAALPNLVLKISRDGDCNTSEQPIPPIP